MQGNITSMYYIGCVLGSIGTYFIGERLGRRTMLMIGGAIMIVGAVILGASYTIAQLIVGHIVTGITNGMNSSTASVLVNLSLPRETICDLYHLRSIYLRCGF